MAVLILTIYLGRMTGSSSGRCICLLVNPLVQFEARTHLDIQDTSGVCMPGSGALAVEGHCAIVRAVIVFGECLGRHVVHSETSMGKCLCSTTLFSVFSLY